MRKQKAKRNKRFHKTALRVLWLITGLSYASTLTYIFFFARRRWAPLSKRTLNLHLFHEKFLFWQNAGVHTRPEVIGFYKDLIGNIVLFIPFPFFLLLFFKVRNYQHSILIAVAASVTVETIQYIFKIGIADIDDVLLNTTGALLGLAVLHVAFFRNNNYRLPGILKTANE